jgi:ribosomal protein S18 acetylase RimI-like enzyme
MIACRPLTDADVEHLWVALFYASHSDDDPDATPQRCRTDPDLARYVEGWGRAGDAGVLALDDEQVIGAAWLRLPTPDERALAAYVADDVPELAIAVLPGHTGGGAGTLMLDALVAGARNKHPAITLNARADNPAVRLYERVGFVTVGTITNRVGTPSVKMLLPLPVEG